MQITINMSDEQKLAMANDLIKVIEDAYNEDEGTTVIEDEWAAFDKIVELADLYEETLVEYVYGNISTKDIQLTVPFTDEWDVAKQTHVQKKLYFQASIDEPLLPGYAR